MAPDQNDDMMIYDDQQKYKDKYKYKHKDKYKDKNDKQPCELEAVRVSWSQIKILLKSSLFYDIITKNPSLNHVLSSYHLAPFLYFMPLSSQKVMVTSADSSAAVETFKTSRRTKTDWAANCGTELQNVTE